MIIMGVDPGYAITGYGILETKNNRLNPLDFGVLTTPARMPIERRLYKIHTGLIAIMREYNPAVLAVEELFFARNTTTAIGTAEARGIALLAAAQYKIPVFEYTPLQVKLAVTGYGKSEKRQVQSMVKLLLHLDEMPKPDDAADALAIAVCQAHTGPRVDFRAVGGYQ
ncbi:crossover junction endodeoxyribonuclease RuvC [Mageeibacillus indolicus]|uniref:Crossover junction endodeoxyribonuclease RuvC n=2 Tax=Mageeibacillus indolicus TaxID=884684 RepID=D3R221_MAGIU|nr:crossover junction endodeoxyribonuclease RuvC [Mageeibacillus indolicus]ADC91680.1 crossover junction endodeoxyribonuclease RuvC [Mageeibacillus indolicus UPII9-5]KFA57407.1 Holliday junction resolvase [Mageeibacillus indolicus 0009-5]PNH19712.1 crossover junction endodeoxyribonuclease RuvC [Mageeibacillus indolicus]